MGAAGRLSAAHRLAPCDSESSSPRAGVSTSSGIEPADHWGDDALAQRADDGPWESLWVYDHFHTTPVPSDEATHEAWTLMAAFAASTSRIRLGQMCTCMGYRNPAYLAKVAATVDLISGGRVEMGIGGGWYEHEWRAYGYGFPPIAERLGDAARGRRDHAARRGPPGAATLDGKHYQVDGAIVQPLPLQDGGIPFWIAGGGEKVTLKIAAQVRGVHELRRVARGVRPQERRAARALRRPRPRLRRDHALVELQHDRRPTTEAEAADRLAAVKRAPAAVRRRGARRHDRARLRRPTGSARPSRSPSGCADAGRARPRLRDPLLPGGGLRPLEPGAVRARGHPGARPEAASPGAQSSAATLGVAVGDDVGARMPGRRTRGWLRVPVDQAGQPGSPVARRRRRPTRARRRRAHAADLAGDRCRRRRRRGSRTRTARRGSGTTSPCVGDTHENR